MKDYFNYGRFAFLFAFLAACFTAQAQDSSSPILASSKLNVSVDNFDPTQRTISGTITSQEDGQPLPGVSILIVGTTTGTISDIDGKYQINAAADQILRFSFIGFTEQEISVGAQSTIDIVLVADAEELEEIIVTGYSVDTRRETTGSVSTVAAKDLQAIPSGNVEQQLQGRVAGVTVITNGQPGTTSQVRVRGFGSFGDNRPLYVVDGVPIQTTEFLNPDDIESTTVLKDAAAASIYGARAAAGVIVFTTKKGKKGKQKMTVTYDGMIGFTDPGSSPEILNPQEQAEWTWNAIRNAADNEGITPVFNHPQYGTGNTPVIPDFLKVGNENGVIGTVDLNAARELYNIDPEAGPIYQVIRPNLAGTDWYDAITRTAMLNRHTLGISGGGDGSRYYFGLGVQEQDGILLHQDFSRYTFRANSEFDLLGGKVRIGENIQGTYRAADVLGGGGGIGSADDENVILTASRMPSIIPVFDEFGGYAGTTAAGFNNGRNPVATLDGDQNDKFYTAQAFGNVYAEIEPIEDLVVRTSIGGRFIQVNGINYTRRQYENSENNSSFGFSQSAQAFTEWVFTNTVNYKKTFGGLHKFDVLLGQEALDQGTGRGFNGSGINPFSQDVDFVTLSTVDNRVVDGFYSKGVRFSSYFGRFNYDFNDKYLFSAVVRRDGSSRFGTENRFGTFPAFSAAWRISSEGFMDGMTWVDDLKIRGGWGIMGNSNSVDPNNQYSLFATSLGASSYDIGGTNSSVVQGFFRSRIGNPAAQWERAITTNIGFDGRFFNDKLDVVLDIWRKDTEDLLFNLPVTAQNGPNAATPFVNIAEMRNQGIDLRVLTRGNIGEMKWELIVNGGFLSNEIIRVADDIEFFENSPDYRGIRPIRNAIGQPLSSFYGYEVEGLFQSDADVDAHADQEGAAPGRFKFRDLDGNGEINADDRTFIGNPVPDFTGGLNIKLEYKNFGLEIYSFASIGNDVFNVSKLFTDFYPLFPGAAISSRVKDSWTPQNTGADIPIFENVSNFSTIGQANSFYVEDASYFRMQNITLSYNLPATLLEKLKMTKARIFLATNNIFTITGYEGLDPSVGGDVDTRFGIDRGNFPITRSFNAGVNLAF